MLTRFNPRLPTLLLAGLLLLMLAGALLPVSVADLLQWGAALASHPLALLGISLGMALLMSVGLPGSLCFWLIAPFHPPLVSVPMLMLGSILGAVGARRLGMTFGDNWRPGRGGRHILQLLARRSDFLTQCAMRTLPGFPHAFINLAAGVLHLPLPGFLLAALIGLGIKWSAYSHAVHGLLNARQAEAALGAGTLLPLAALAGLMLAGSLLRRLWKHG
ncbi:MAG: VTT domain-containing protein [Halopseudomonas yangmingensis]